MQGRYAGDGSHAYHVLRSIINTMVHLYHICGLSLPLSDQSKAHQWQHSQWMLLLSSSPMTSLPSWYCDSHDLNLMRAVTWDTHCSVNQDIVFYLYFEMRGRPMIWRRRYTSEATKSCRFQPSHLSSVKALSPSGERSRSW